MNYVAELLKIITESIAEFFKNKDINLKDEVIQKPAKAYTPYKGTPGGGRKMSPELASFFIKRLEKLPAYQRALVNRDAREIFFLAAQCAEGVREKGGNNKGYEVELFQKVLGGASQEAWCMAFVQACLAFAEYATGIKSPIFASEHCMTTWGKTKVDQRVNDIPLRGAIVIWRHGTSTSGHTGVVETCDGVTFTAYEGNTEGGFNESGAIVREGGGVWHTKRKVKTTGSMKLIGFLKPF